MAKFKFEYIWQDGYQPEANLRSKTKVLEFNEYKGELDPLPEWSFDGSSTQQAEGHSSDCLLKPVAVYPDSTRINGFLVICEVLNPDGTAHNSNFRATIPENTEEYWFGFEQEYVLEFNDRPVGFPEQGYPRPQGPYYCAVGYGNVAARDVVEEHLDICLDAGLNITGVNAEVMLGQWEYQCFRKGAKKASDDLILSRYLLYRVCENYGMTVNLHPKPVKGDWNGSGMHANFSNSAMRESGKEETFTKICESFGRNIHRHIDVYGAHNDKRLTGAHETQSIDLFSYGVSDRGASIRIPITTMTDGWVGRLEDRRTASNADPYKVAAVIIKTTNEGLAS